MSLFATALMLTTSLLLAPTSAASPLTLNTLNTQDASQTAAATSGHVTILVLDMSGSMANNDPDGLRCSAANAYIDLSGSGDYIGVVGLDSTGARGGDHNFQLAQTWANPQEMATIAQRNALKQTIAEKSHNCHPDSSTPTYDALARALAMLKSTTQNGKIAGSVILLTDGAPDPNTDDQKNAIRDDLVPQFKQGGWPVDTVALGEDSGGFHQALSDIASATSGGAYDDGHGVVQGISPLNIADFFVQLFAQRNGLTLQRSVPATTLSGGTLRKNFQVGDGADRFCAVSVKERSGTTVALKTPSGITLSDHIQGVTVLTDPHYYIFCVDSPQSGNWELDATGSGGFLMDSLIVSSIRVAIVTPDGKSAQPLGQPLNVSAQLTSHGNVITGSAYTVTGTLTYTGGNGATYNQELVLNDKASPGTYKGTANVPLTAPAGTYDLAISAGQGSTIALTSSHLTLRLEIFPLPYLYTAGTTRPTDKTVTGTVVRWDPALQVIYGLNNGIVQWISQWPLAGLPGGVQANLPGVVQLSGKSYPNATVHGTAVRQGSSTSVPITALDDGDGTFRVRFPATADGTYTITFQTSGVYADSHGDFGTTQRTATLTVVNATPAQEIRAWLVTLLYILFLIVVVLFIRYLFLPEPSGQVVSSSGDRATPRNINTRRSIIRRLLNRNILDSRKALGKGGLLLRFDRRGRVAAKAYGRGGEDWYDQTNRPISDNRYQAVTEVRYRPGAGGSDDDDALYSRTESYVFQRPGRGGEGRSSGRSGRGGASRINDGGRGRASKQRNTSASRSRTSSARSRGGRASSARRSYDDGI